MASGVVHAIGAAFVIPRQEVVTMATGPGFRSRLASVASHIRRVTNPPQPAANECAG